MPSFTITMGDPTTGRPGRRFTVEAPTLSLAYAGVYADPDAIGLVPVAAESDAPAPDAKRGCTCRPDGLTRCVTLWECAGCGHVQSGRRRRCEACERRKPRHPSPHPEHHYLTEAVERGEFTDRRGVRRCVGCQREIPTP